MRTWVLIVIVVMLSCVVGTVALTQSNSYLLWTKESYTITNGNLNSGGQTNMHSVTYSTSMTFGQSSPIGVNDTNQMYMGVQYIYTSN